jgi:WD40 repeat protein
MRILVFFHLFTPKGAVSDIHWSPLNPDLLASCSYDAYIHLWDVRQSTLPQSSFCAWTAGVTQVKWNRFNAFLLASSHDNDIRIWDLRMGSSPIVLITAHMKKIYGLDWSRNSEKELLSCGQDQTVKFWDYTESRQLGQIDTHFPVWRARFTVFLLRYTHADFSPLEIMLLSCLKAKIIMSICGIVIKWMSPFLRFLVIQIFQRNLFGVK